VDRIEIFTGTKKLSTHERMYGNNKWCLNADHYLELIQRRPMAFHSRVLKKQQICVLYFQV